MNAGTSPPLPLAGVSVVEFCSIAAGPFCGMLLADMGADVVKIEPPAGDAMRAWPPVNAGYSENFASLNRNKRSAVFDLKTPDGLAAARALAERADIVIENNRPGVMDRLGLGYPALSAVNPRLIYCSISAYGQSGPRSSEGGFDLTMQAAAGVMSVTGDSDAPVKCGVPISDFSSGLYAAFSAACALVAAVKRGKGVHIDVPMFGCTLAVGALQTSEFFGTGQNPKKLGSAHPRNAPYQAYQARDGYFVIAAGNDNLWRAVMRAVPCPELADDPRFASIGARAANQQALKILLEARFIQHDVSHWMQVFQQAGVPHSRINDYSQALQDPQVEHMQWVKPVALPGGHRTRTFASPLMLDGAGLPLRHGPPALGEHTQEILDSIHDSSGGQLATHR